MSDAIRLAAMDVRYKLGERLVKAGDRRGPIDAAAEKLGLTPGQAYECRVLASRYTREQFEAFKRLRRKDGRPLSMSHLVYSARVGDPAKRLALLEKAARNNLSPAAFNALVVKANRR